MFISKIKSNIYVENLGCLSLLFLRIGELEIDRGMIFSPLTPKYRTGFPFSEEIGLTVIKIQQGDILLGLHLHLKQHHNDEALKQNLQCTNILCCASSDERVSRQTKNKTPSRME